MALLMFTNCSGETYGENFWMVLAISIYIYTYCKDVDFHSATIAATINISAVTVYKVSLDTINSTLCILF